MCLSPSWCSLCKEDGENIDHILLHYSFSHAIWAKLMAQFGVVAVFPKRWSDFSIIKWSFPRNCKKSKMLWRFATLAMAWLLWKERNQRIFKGKSGSIDDIWEHDRFLSGLWAASSKVLDSPDAI